MIVAISWFLRWSMLKQAVSRPYHAMHNYPTDITFCIYKLTCSVGRYCVQLLYFSLKPASWWLVFYSWTELKTVLFSKRSLVQFCVSPLGIDTQMDIHLGFQAEDPRFHPHLWDLSNSSAEVILVILNLIIVCLPHTSILKSDNVDRNLL